MGGGVSCEGKLASVYVSSSTVTVTSTSAVPIVVQVYKRSGTNRKTNMTETFKVEYHLSPGEKAAGDCDYDITKKKKIAKHDGLDYCIRIHSDSPGQDNKASEVVQIVYDGTYSYYPNVKLIADRGELLTRAPTGRLADIEARIKALGDEILETRKVISTPSTGQDQVQKMRRTVSRIEEQRMQVIEELYAASEAGESSFEDALSEFLDDQDSKVSFSRSREDKSPTLDAVPETSLIREPDDWWDEADVAALGLAVTSRVKDCRLMPKPTKQVMPWLEGQSTKLYEEMGMMNPSKIYLALWMVLGNALVLTVSEVVDRRKFEEMMSAGEQACLEKNFKLVMTPIHVSPSCASILPASATDPASADYVKKFLGSKGSSMYRTKLPSGVEYACLMVDFNGAGRLVSWAIKSVGFRAGHVLDLHVVDWTRNALFASGRLSVTPEVKALI